MRQHCAPRALARAAIGKPWRTARFKRHLEGRSDADWPVAIVPQRALDAVSGRSPTLRLSGESAAKQTKHHPDLAPTDYARVQRILDKGELFASGDRSVIGFIEEDGRHWRAVVKATADGSETYLVSLHKSLARRLDAARRRRKIIGEKGG